MSEITVLPSAKFYGRRRAWREHDVAVSGRCIGTVSRNGGTRAKWNAIVLVGAWRQRIIATTDTREEAVNALVASQKLSTMEMPL